MFIKLAENFNTYARNYKKYKLDTEVVKTLWKSFWQIQEW